MKKYNYFIVGVLLFFMATTFMRCSDTGNSEFVETDQGLLYKILEKNEGGKKIELGSFLDFHVVVKNAKDSVVVNSYEEKQTGLVKNFPYDSTAITRYEFTEIFGKLAEGDSAVIRVSTDSIIAKNKRKIQERIDLVTKNFTNVIDTTKIDSLKQNYQKMLDKQVTQLQTQMSQVEKDPNYPAGKFEEYTFKIVAVKTEAEMKKEQEEEQKKHQKEVEQRIKDEKKKIKEYLKKNKLEAESTASGLHYIIHEEGTGETPEAGDQVSVNYVGKLIDSGEVFDTNIKEEGKKLEKMAKRPDDSYQPFKFQIGRRQVIPGWDEGLSLLKKGSKATLYIPSHIAYGEQGAGQDIPPNSILVFDIEFLDIEKAPKE